MNAEPGPGMLLPPGCSAQTLSEEELGLSHSARLEPKVHSVSQETQNPAMQYLLWQDWGLLEDNSMTDT